MDDNTEVQEEKPKLHVEIRVSVGNLVQRLWEVPIIDGNMIHTFEPVMADDEQFLSSIVLSMTLRPVSKPLDDGGFLLALADVIDMADDLALPVDAIERLRAIANTLKDGQVKI